MAMEKANNTGAAATIQWETRKMISQMLADSGINQETLKEMVRAVLDEKVGKAIKQVMAETNLERMTNRRISDLAMDMVRDEVSARMKQTFQSAKITFEAKTEPEEATRLRAIELSPLRNATTLGELCPTKPYTGEEEYVAEKYNEVISQLAEKYGYMTSEIKATLVWATEAHGAKTLEEQVAIAQREIFDVSKTTVMKAREDTKYEI